MSNPINNNKPKDTDWKEYKVHVDDIEEEEEEYVNHLFEKQDDDDELLEFQFDSLKIQLRGHSDITNTTGLSVWLGAEVLCQFLLQNRSLLEHKSVLELGSGLGLSGLLVAHLGAARTVLTDGDVGVLRQLRSNMKRNTTKNPTISCPQLIWGRDLDAFREQHGRFQVILATDCVYMTASLEPLWQTIAALLEENDEAVVVYVNLCASQAPHEDVVETACRNGFSSPTSPSKDVYLFQRKLDEKKEQLVGEEIG